MRTVSEDQLGALLGAVPGIPRVVASGNFATPWRALSALDATIAGTGCSCSTRRQAFPAATA